MSRRLTFTRNVKKNLLFKNNFHLFTKLIFVEIFHLYHAKGVTFSQYD